MSSTNIGRVRMIPRGEYDAGHAYEPLDIVTYQGGSRVAKRATQGNPPTDLTYWDVIAERGSQGAQGKQGDRGEQGFGLMILDNYPTLPQLEAAIQAPKPGDAYGIGTEEPYEIYIYSETGRWVNYGALIGIVRHSIIPEDPVPVSSMAVISYVREQVEEHITAVLEASYG